MLLEILCQFLMDPSRTAQCIVGLWHLLSQCLRGGKPAIVFKECERMNSSSKLQEEYSLEI